MSEMIFSLPDVGEGLTEAEIVTWHVAAGDTVELNQVICEIETAKSLVELPAPFSGVVTEVLAEVGQTVPVGEAILKVRGEGGSPSETSDDDEGSMPADSDETRDAVADAAGLPRFHLVGESIGGTGK